MSRRRARSILARLARPLADLTRRVIGKDELGEEPRKPDSSAGSQTFVPKELVSEAFTLAIDQLRREDEGRFQTKLHVLSLVEFREAVGDRWYRVSDKVLLIAETIIIAHIGTGNVFGRMGEDLYVLVFRECPPPEARRRATRIAQELGTRLLGNQFDGEDRPVALAAEVLLADVVGADCQFNLDALMQAVTEVRSQTHAEPARENVFRRALLPSVLKSLPRLLRRHLLPGEMPDTRRPGLRYSLLPSKTGRQADRPALRRSLMPGPDVRTESGGRATVAAPSWQAKTANPAQPRRPPDPEWKTAAPARAPAPPRPARIEPPPMGPDVRLSTRWRPTWLALGQVIGGYEARACRIDGDGQQPYEGALAYPLADATSIQTLDRHVCAAAMREMRAAEAAATGALFILPVHWRSIASAERMSILMPLADVSEGARRARLVIDLFGVPIDVAGRDLADGVRTLKGMCRDVALRTSLAAPRAAMAAECGATLIGIDLAESPPDEPVGDERLLAALGKFHATAKRASLATYLWGAPKRRIVAGAVLGGFAMVNGPGLMKDLPRPARIAPAPRQRFAEMMG